MALRLYSTVSTSRITDCGFTPLIWDPFFKSLAVVIICGLSFATFLTLIVVPVLYAAFFRIGANEASGAESQRGETAAERSSGSQEPDLEIGG